MEPRALRSEGKGLPRQSTIWPSPTTWQPPWSEGLSQVSWIKGPALTASFLYCGPWTRGRSKKSTRCESPSRPICSASMSSRSPRIRAIDDDPVRSRDECPVTEESDTGDTGASLFTVWAGLHSPPPANDGLERRSYPIGSPRPPEP